MKTSTLIRRFLPYFKKYRGMLFLDLVCAALTTVCDLVLPLIAVSYTHLDVYKRQLWSIMLIKWMELPNTNILNLHMVKRILLICLPLKKRL